MITLNKIAWSDFPEADRLFGKSILPTDDITLDSMKADLEADRASLYIAILDGEFVGGLVVAVDKECDWLEVVCIAIVGGHSKNIPEFFPALAELAKLEGVGHSMCEVSRAALMNLYCNNGFFIDSARLLMAANHE